MNELSRKLQEFQSILPAEVFIDPQFIGYRINEQGTELTIVWASAPVAKDREAFLHASAEVAAFLQRESLALTSLVEDAPRAQAVAAGTSGFGQGLNGWGTLGWFIYLDDQLVCVSNHHVLCAAGDQSRIGTPVYSGSLGQATKLGYLYEFDPIESASPRLFDFALAAVDSPSLVSSMFAACDNGDVHPYPKRLGFTENITGSGTYTKVGARSPVCAEGRFRGLTSTYVTYANGKKYFFVEQLLLDPISRPGDSGSIVVHSQTNSVIGLIFAGNEGVSSLANPLYRKGWTYVGTRAVDNFELPMFASAKTRAKLFAADLRPSLGPSQLPPIFQPGRSLQTPLAMSDWLRSRNASSPEVIQPYGDWVEIRAQVANPYGPVNISGWLNANTGLIYPVNA